MERTVFNLFLDPFGLALNNADLDFPTESVDPHADDEALEAWADAACDAEYN